MTSRDVERLMDLWLADGPLEVHERVIEGVADRIGHQRQQPAWRVSWRDSHVNASLKPVAAIAAIIVIAIVGSRLIASPSGPGGGPTASPTPSSSPVPSARWDTFGAQCGDVGCGGPLTAGTYTSRGLVPAVTYTLTSPWVNLRDWSGFFQLYPDTPANRAVAAGGDYPPHILILPGPQVSPSDTCVDYSPSDMVGVDAAQLVAFLEARPHLVISGSVPVTINGLAGRQIDVSIGAGWTGCIPGAPLGEHLTTADKVRFIVLDRPGKTSLMIRLRAPSDFSGLAADAMPVIESFVFGPDPSPSPS